jgi:Predicted membrane protein
LNTLFSFQGSIGRLQFTILFVLSLFVYSVPIFLLPSVNAVYIITRLIIMILALICYCSAIVRRLHDIGYYREDLLLILIPIYNLYLIFLMFSKKGYRIKCSKVGKVATEENP